MPSASPRTSIVTSAPADLRGLETFEQPSTARGGGTKLEGLLAQLQDGYARDVRSAEDALDGFFAARLWFLLHPRDAAIAGLSFQIDDSPLTYGAATAFEPWSGRGDDAEVFSTPPEAIAIRIEELAIRNMGTLSTDIRIDALICTRSRSGSGYAAWTHRCRGVTDGDPLPLASALIFHGPVHDFVDILLWVSRGTEASPDLAQLLAQRAAHPEFQNAAGSLSIGQGAAPVRRDVDAGAIAVLAQIARDGLLEAAGTSIGLYRASFSAGEHFGVGRQPSQGSFRAEAASFSLRIEPASIAGHSQ